MSGLSADLIEEMAIEPTLDEPDVVVIRRKPGTWDREQARYWAQVRQARERNLRRIHGSDHGQA